MTKLRCSARRGGVALCVAVWAHFIMACCCMSGDSSTKNPQPKADFDLQSQREKLIENFKAEGVIDKVTGESVAKLWVKPRFLAQRFEDKKKIANLVYSWFYQLPKHVDSKDLDPGDHVQIMDHLTGRKIGSYDPISGLKMDD